MRDVRKINLSAMSGFEDDIVIAANNANIFIVTTLMTTLKAGQASAGAVTATNNGSTNKGSSRVAHQVHLLR